MGVAPSRVARAFAVLETFTPERPSLALSEVARRAGLPLTTTHLLLGEWDAVFERMAKELSRSGAGAGS